jgi:alcohol dehydrogenase class IV
LNTFAYFQPTDIRFGRGMINDVGKIGMWLSLKGLGATMEDVSAIADNSRVLPDYKNNPRIADREEIYEILVKSYDRK